jgi:ribonuclease HI
MAELRGEWRLAVWVEKNRVQSASELMVRQINGEHSIKNGKRVPLFEKTRVLLRHFDSYRILHVHRDPNRLADRLANKGVDDAVKKSSAG